jgi:hypothetical protein
MTNENAFWFLVSLSAAFAVVVIAGTIAMFLLPDEEPSKEDALDHIENCEVCQGLCERCNEPT